ALEFTEAADLTRAASANAVSRGVDLIDERGSPRAKGQGGMLAKEFTDPVEQLEAAFGFGFHGIAFLFVVHRTLSPGWEPEALILVGLQFVSCWLCFRIALALRKSRLIGFDFAARCIREPPATAAGPPKNFGMNLRADRSQESGVRSEERWQDSCSLISAPPTPNQAH